MRSEALHNIRSVFLTWTLLLRNPSSGHSCGWKEIERLFDQSLESKKTRLLDESGDDAKARLVTSGEYSHPKPQCRPVGIYQDRKKCSMNATAPHDTWWRENRAKPARHTTIRVTPKVRRQVQVRKTKDLDHRKLSV